MPIGPNTEKSPSLHFGVMCSGTVFQRWQADTLLELKKNGHRVELLIIDARKPPKVSLLNKILKKKWKLFLFTFLDNRIFKPAAKLPVDLHKELIGIDTIHCTVSRRGFSEYFDEADYETIRGYGLDFILRFGFNIIRGGILTAARFGVWSFHHDDEMVYRGGPPGFWEIYKGDPVSGAIMQKLTEKLDAGVILKKGYLKTNMHSYRENLNQLLSVSSTWPAMLADEILQVPENPDKFAVPATHKTSSTAAPVYRVPGNLQMLKFLSLLLVNRIKFYYKEMLAAEIWNVGVILKPIREVALSGVKIKESDVIWLPKVAHSGYLADPAGFILEGRLHILAEDYSYASQKACISEIIMDINKEVVGPGIFHPPVRVMKGIPHLSYPFVFEYDRMIYCLPESYQSSQVTLYRRDPAGKSFTREAILLTDIQAVDPTLFFFSGMWWLFFTGRRYSNTHLFLYHSEKLSGEFKPHPLNPVKIDIRSARPAGTPFIFENVLYRPAQDCSATYGGRIAINRVTSLSPDDFAEETVNFIEPVEGCAFGKGLHTISSVGNVTLIDGKRYKPDYLFLSHQLRKKINRKGTGNV